MEPMAKALVARAFVALMLAGAWGAACPSPAQPTMDADSSLLDFDIPRQALRAALLQFGEVSGSALLYETQRLPAQEAGPLQGRYTPAEGLRTLIASTGLRVKEINAKSFVLVLPELAAMPSAATVTQWSPVTTRYYGLLQARLERVLCGDPLTRPGSYGAGLRMWLDGAGRLQQFELARSSGDATRDAALASRLRGFSVGAPPPPGLRQPVTLVMEPGALANTGDCAMTDRQKAGSRGPRE